MMQKVKIPILPEKKSENINNIAIVTYFNFILIIQVLMKFKIKGIEKFAKKLPIKKTRTDVLQKDLLKLNIIWKQVSGEYSFSINEFVDELEEEIDVNQFFLHRKTLDDIINANLDLIKNTEFKIPDHYGERDKIKISKRLILFTLISPIYMYWKKELGEFNDVWSKGGIIDHLINKDSNFQSYDEDKIFNCFGYTLGFYQWLCFSIKI